MSRRDEAVGMSAPLSSKVSEVIGFLREHIGDGVKCTVEWDRTGAMTLPLVGGQPQQWTAQNIFGRLGEFSISAPTSNLPVTEATCMYRVIGNDLEVTPKVLLKGFSSQIAPGSYNPAVGASEKPVGFAVASVLSIFSLAYGIYQLLNPQVAIEVPGNVVLSLTVTGDTMEIDFDKFPVLTVQAWFSLRLGMKHLIVTPSVAHIDFCNEGGIFSGFVKSREIVLT